MRKIEIPTDTPTEFEFGDTAADIHMRDEGEQREKGGRKTTEGGEGEEARTEETPQSHTEKVVAEKRPRAERSDSKMDTESQSRHKKGQMMDSLTVR